VQFTIRTLLAVILAVAVLCCVFFTLPNWLSLIVLAVLSFAVFPAALVSGVIYGRAFGRAFSIGALTPLACFAISMLGYATLGLLSVVGDLVDNVGNVDNSELLVPIKISVGILWAAAATAGFASVAVRWLCLRSAIRDLNRPPSGMRVEPTIRRRMGEAPQSTGADECGEVPREALVRPR
jgi:hypothetical protein